MIAPIELLNIRHSTKEGNVRAFLSIRIGGVTINNCKVVQQPGMKAWAAMPDREYLDSSGSKRWAQIVELSPELRRRVCDFVAEYWSEHHPDRGMTAMPEKGDEPPF